MPAWCATTSRAPPRSSSSPSAATGTGRASAAASSRTWPSALRSEGIALLQVKTFGPSGDSPEYELTRAFYESIGFIPLEELRELWDEDNPCLILVMPLEAVPADGGSGFSPPSGP